MFSLPLSSYFVIVQFLKLYITTRFIKKLIKIIIKIKIFLFKLSVHGIDEGAPFTGQSYRVISFIYYLCL